ncbi:hypothetical protein BH11ARM1_BH11ARM1_01560 [soil metagenome]
MSHLQTSAPKLAHVVAATVSDPSALPSLADVMMTSLGFQQADQLQQVAAHERADGIDLVFFGEPADALDCAKSVEHAGGSRVALHSGLVQFQTDTAGDERLVGEGLTTALALSKEALAGSIKLSSTFEQLVGKASESVPSVAGGKKVVLLYRRQTEPDGALLRHLERELTRNGYDVFVDQHLKIGVAWAKEIEAKIRAAHYAIALVSSRALESEMIEYELETAQDEFDRSGRPQILPVRISADSIEGPVGSILNQLNGFEWSGPDDNARLVIALISAMTEAVVQPDTEIKLEPVGGAVTPDSPFYLKRPADAEFEQAIRDGESIILLKGPRQIGKTSLMSQGIRLASSIGRRHAITDFQKVGQAQLASEEAFMKLLAHTLCRQLSFKYDFENEWLDVFGAGLNMESFLRALLDSSDVPLVWFMDEVDKVFTAPFASDFFGLVRSWHNSRSTEPGTSWDKLTVVIAYATEAHLFIQDLNQSPFNVGRRLELDDFTLQQLVDLNARYGSPLRDINQIEMLHKLVGGQPFLTRRALDVIARSQMTFDELVANSTNDDGPFGDHLKRILISVTRAPAVEQAMRSVLETRSIPDSESFYRLSAAGLVRKLSDGAIVPRCELYQTYLKKHLA